MWWYWKVDKDFSNSWFDVMIKCYVLLFLYAQWMVIRASNLAIWIAFGMINNCLLMSNACFISFVGVV